MLYVMSLFWLLGNQRKQEEIVGILEQVRVPNRVWEKNKNKTESIGYI